MNNFSSIDTNTLNTMYNDARKKIETIKKELEYREKTAKDDEIWSKILDDKKLQKKFIVIKNTNKIYLLYNGNFVHFVSEPDMKKNLKTTPRTSEQIVKVSDMRMMIH